MNEDYKTGVFTGRLQTASYIISNKMLELCDICNLESSISISSICEAVAMALGTIYLEARKRSVADFPEPKDMKFHILEMLSDGLDLYLIKAAEKQDSLDSSNGQIH